MVDITNATNDNTNKNPSSSAVLNIIKNDANNIIRNVAFMLFIFKS